MIAFGVRRWLAGFNLHSARHSFKDHNLICLREVLITRRGVVGRRKKYHGQSFPEATCFNFNISIKVNCFIAS